MNPLFEKGQKVKLPFNETGTIKQVENLVWFNRYQVKIRKATFNKTNQVMDFLEREITLE
jgi:hypothetical protein